MVNGIQPEFIYPGWDVPNNIRAVFTTRTGGHSQGDFKSFNLGLHVNDSTSHVETNRQLLVDALKLPDSPCYLNQIHGTDVVHSSEVKRGLAPQADGSWTDVSDKVISIMTADCLPVLFASRCGSVIGGAHAGWRGLASGVLENTIGNLPVDASELHAWLGPAIGPQHFEVGAEVREHFMAISIQSEEHFKPVSSDKYLADLYGLARDRLHTAGVLSVTGGDHCTYAEQALFFSHRRDKGKTGRMAALIWKV